MANRGQWSDALTLTPEDESNYAWQTFKAVALARLQRWDEARELLEAQSELEMPEAFLLDWLQSPNKRLTPRDTVQPVLHSLYGTERIGPIVVKVMGPVRSEVLQACAQFHNREFPNHHLEFHLINRSYPAESFEDLRNSLEVGQEPPWLETGHSEICLVSAQSNEQTAYSRGFGSDNIAVVHYLEDDPFQATTTSHELYHTLLDLNHSNGLEGPDEPGSVMGPWGLTAPLLNTYIASSHRSCCTTSEEVQLLVEAKKWEEALSLDPDYLGLYQKVADRYLAEGQANCAVEKLKDWFQRDPGPEAASAWLQRLLDLEQDWPHEIGLCRGYGKAANTHIYLAQACIRAYRFDLALQQIEEALDLEPEHLFALAMRGWSQHCSGRWEDADSDYLKVLATVPDWEAVLQRRALLASGVWQNGYKVQHDPLPGELWDEDCAWLAAWRAAPQRALEILEPFGSQASLHLKGFLHFQLGRTERASDMFRQSVSSDGVSLYGRAGLAWLDHLKGEPHCQKLARRVLERWAFEPTCRWLLDQLPCQ